jgi:hypothetical protein
MGYYRYPHEAGLRRWVAFEQDTIRGYIDAKSLQSAYGVSRMRGYPQVTIVPIEICLRGLHTH